MKKTKFKLLSKINFPKDIRNLNISSLSELSSEIAFLISETIKENGGHFSSPLGVIDLTLALHYCYNTPKDKLFWDVGHQAYAHKIITGRKELFNTIRKKNGISGFLKISESPYDVFGAGHASTSISAALGYAHGRDLTNSSNRVVAVIGDGSMTGGLAYEGINNLGYHRTQLTIVLNDNSMSISKSVGALSKYLAKLSTNKTYNKVRDDVWKITGKIPFSSKIRSLIKRTEGGLKSALTPGGLFEDLGIRYIGPIDGHDIKVMIKTFKLVRTLKGPVLVHVYTNKGRGDDAAETDSVKFYSLSGRQQNNNKPKSITYSAAFSDIMLNIAKQNNKVVCVTAAMEKGTGLEEFANNFNNRHFDVGIAEEHAVTYSAGLSIAGYIPIVAIYSTFIQRSYDQIFHDIALQDIPVVICLDRAGLVGPDGPTHHGVFDINIFRSIPNIIISAPKDGDELQNLIFTAIESKKIFIIRYPKGDCIKYSGYNPKSIKLGSWEMIKEGDFVAILAVGSMLEIANDACKIIREKLNINIALVNARFIKPLDEDLLHTVLGKYSKIITLEEGMVNGGFGGSILEFANKNNYSNSFTVKGIEDEFIEQGTRTEQLEDCKLDANSIAREVERSLNEETIKSE